LSRYRRPSLASRLARFAWRCLKISLVAFMAMGPAPPPPPLPKREVAELHVKSGQERTREET
jgi:hypothetical protein